MRQRLSTRSILTAASVVTMSMLWVLFVLPGTGTVAGNLIGTLTVLAAMWLALQMTRSTALAPRTVAVLPVRVSVPPTSAP
jgi:hypothetical protein